MSLLILILLAGMLQACQDSYMGCEDEQCCNQRNRECTTRCTNLSGYDATKCWEGCGQADRGCRKFVAGRKRVGL
jgi:hypothetical protein